MNIMNENTTLTILVISLIVIIGIVFIVRFLKLNKEERITAIKQWLIYAVSIAEKELGEGTGKLKLRYVYDMFITKFPPSITKHITFEEFSIFVDEALIKMKSMIETNPSIADIIQNY